MLAPIMQVATKRCLLVWLLLACTRANIVYVNGDYILQVRTHSYDNPTNRCAGCGDDQGCCDDFDVFECTGELRCDNYFSYCLSTLGGSEFQCEGTSRTSTSSQPDGGMIDFLRDMVLGLPNPLPLIGISDAWNGVQLVVEAIDSDPRRSSPDELVDRFQIDISTTIAPVGIETNATTFYGTFGFATIELSFRVVCASNYSGPDCSDFCDPSTETCVCRPGFIGVFCATNINDCEGITCSENGVCVDGIDTYQCNCNVGFNGVQCEMNIDDCDGVNCSGNGQCADGINNFTCTCDLGFTGQLCEIDIDDCEGITCSGNGVCVDGIDSFQCNCNTGFTGQLCETNIDNCVEVDCSGNGQCEDGVDFFTCVCDPGFTGDLCSDSIKGSNSKRAAIVGGSVAGSVLLVLFLLVVTISICILTNKCIKAADQQGEMDIKENEAYGTVSSSRGQSLDDMELKENIVYGINSRPGVVHSQFCKPVDQQAKSRQSHHDPPDVHV